MWAANRERKSSRTKSSRRCRPETRRARAPTPHNLSEIKKGGKLPPLNNPNPSSQHLHAFHVDGISHYMAGHCYVMAFMSGQGVRIINRQNFLAFIGYNHQLLAGLDALLGALGGLGVCALDAAFGVGHVSVHGGRV